MIKLRTKNPKDYLSYYKRLTKTFFGVLFVLGFSSFNLNAFESGKTEQTKPIIGHAPFLSLIGAIMSEPKPGIYTPDLQPYNSLYVGSKIGIPIIDCNLDISNEEKLIQLFDFKDLDGDICHLQPSDLKWYILHNQNVEWENVKGFEDLIVQELTLDAFPDNIEAPIHNFPLSQLIVPIDAVGKRIGFKYQPRTVEGSPKLGQEIHVWDLNYTFKQNPIQTPEQNDFVNQGTKLSRIQEKSAGGIVPPIITPPEVENVFLSGRFGLDESLQLNYSFISNTQNKFEDVSRFRWGLDEPLAELIEWSSSNISPKLSLNEIGKTYGLFFIPLKLENEIIVQGKDLLRVTTDGTNNEIINPPQIINLDLLSPNLESIKDKEQQYVRAGDVLTVTYDFLSEQIEVYDNSIFTWFDDETNLEVTSGEITKENSTIEYTITEQDIGNSLRLDIIPKDSSQLKGLPVSLTTPKLAKLDIITELTFVGAPQINSTLSATYTFNQLNEDSKDSSYFFWYYINEDNLNVDLSSGVIKTSGIVPESMPIPLFLKGKKIYLDIIPRDQTGIIGDIVTIAADVPDIEEINLFGDNQLELSFYIPVQLNATALFTDKSTMNISHLGAWSIDNPKIEILESNKLKPKDDAIGEQGNIVFNYEGKDYNAVVNVVSSKLSEIAGSQTDFVSIISGEETPKINLYGMGVWDAIRDPESDEILAGGTGGRLGGNILMSNTSQFNFNQKISSIEAMSILGTEFNRYEYLLHTLSWKDREGYGFHFKGDKRTDNLDTTVKSIIVTNQVFGWIVFSSGEIGQENTYIMGLQLVYY